MLKIKINSISGYKEGTVIEVASDKDGTPIDVVWRRRLKDAILDNCVEVVIPTPDKKPKGKK